VDRRPEQSLAPAPPAPLTEYQQVIQASTGRSLPIFGASIFSFVPSTFAPVDNVPVTPDYVIGPGDELRLQIWGQVNQRGDFVVDRTGSISLPEVGTVHVAGLQFSQLSDFLKSQLARVYRNFDLNVNMGQLRSIQVFVAGQARQAGSFTIGSLSTLLNALFASGGPLPQGSLRDIQVKRGGQTITHFDLYDLLLHGDKSKDVRLESGDVIFIPDVGPQVAVMGSVTNPAIYELREEKSFNQVIALAGGLTNVASGSEVRVERIYRHAERSIIDVNPAAADAPEAQDGDIVLVTPILERFQNAVTLRGNVAMPGRYVWHQGMRISDLIPTREALITRDYYQRQNQLGQANRDYSPEYSAASGSLGLRSGPAADAAANRVALGANGGGNAVGAALTSGSNTFGPSTDVVLTAPDIDWEYAVVERQNSDNLATTLLTFNLAKAVVDKDPSQDLTLLPRDIVTVFSKADIRLPSNQQTKFVRLEGEFVAAGVYSVAPGETLRQLIARAGGLTSQADLFASEFTRDTVRRLQKQRLLEYADELESQITATTSANSSSALTDRDASAAAQSAAAARAVATRLRQAQPTGRIVLPLKPDSSGIEAVPDFELQDGDRFVVPRGPTTVSVEGQVYNANAFLYVKGKRVKDYLRLAGGPDRIADQKREFILRADGSVVSHQYAPLAERAIFVNHDFEDAVLYPGDTIIVPPIIQKTALLRNLSDIGTILEGFGLGAAAVSVLK
jgi:protein involved in polysaccharide export with SLBB domain